MYGASEVIGPITFVEQPIDYLIDERINKCIATDSENSTNPASSARQPCKNGSNHHGSQSYSCCFSNPFQIHLPEYRVPRHHLGCHSHRKHYLHTITYPSINQSHTRIL